MNKDNSRKTILIVDDTEGIHRTIRRILFNGGNHYNIISAMNCHQAKALLEKNKVDLVILDINMPEVSGLEFLPNIKKNHPEVPVVVMSGECDKSIISEAFKNGCSDYIVKPFDISELHYKVSKLTNMIM